MKWKAKVVLLKVSFDEIHSWDIQGNQMKGEGDVSGNMIDELHSSDIHGDQMEGKSGVT